MLNVFEQLGFSKEESKELELRAMLHICALKAKKLTNSEHELGRVSEYTASELANLLLDILT